MREDNYRSVSFMNKVTNIRNKTQLTWIYPRNATRV